MQLPHQATLRLLISAVLCGGALAPALAATSGNTLPPVEAFFENSRFASPRLSPDGRYLAARVAKPGERDRLSVVKLDDMSVKVVAMFADADVGYFDWVNNNRLVFNGRDRRVTHSDDNMPAGIFAVNRDGSGFRQLSETVFHTETTGTIIGSKMLSWNHLLLPQRGRQDDDTVYVERYIWNAGNTEVTTRALYRLNTVTGQAVPVATPPQSVGWLLDQRGEVRIAYVNEEKKRVTYVRSGDGDSASWQRLSETTPYGQTRLNPVDFAPDGTLYVAARVNSDKSALYRYDLGNGQLGKEPVLAMDDYDYLPDLENISDGDHTLITRNGKLLGASYLADVPGVAWFDAKAQALQAAVDAALPNRVNLLKLPRDGDTPWVLVRTHSDIEPPSYLIYNRDSKQLLRVGATHEQIRPEQMGRQELVHYKARDGLDIPAWITYPHGARRQQLPLVVLVHGGPFVRGGSWGWNADAQFLASRGYAVLEPEYRGSTGFGWKHFRAGWKQWGLAMQDDIADGVLWATKQGIVDPQRVCIAGASYGGYAVLMGLIRDPQLYRCGVEWAGVTDIKLMYTGSWSAKSDFSDRWKTYGMPNLIGDLEQDAAQLQATSPLAQASRIKAPLLLAYGTDDQRVPPYHGEKFYAAVKAGNPNVEWVAYEKEGHGWALPENRYDWWRRVEQFLQRNIGEGAAK
ncbi:MAG: prolyl oligopeptidase family serine peptidase [Sphingomonadaceae bacterium]